MLNSPRKRKVVRIIGRLNVGGPAQHVVWLTEALNDDVFTSILVTGTIPPGETDMGYFARAHGLQPIRIAEMSRRPSMKDLVAIWKLLRILQRERPDVVHTHTAKAGTVGRVAGLAYRWLTPGTLLGKPRRVRVFHTFHGNVFRNYYGRFKTRIILFVEHLLARTATDRLIVLCEQQRTELVETFGVAPSRKVAIIPIGIEMSTLQEPVDGGTHFRRDIGASRDDFVVGIVGRLTEIKDHALFLEAAAACLERGEVRRMRFVVIGDGHLRTTLQSARAHPRVVFAGNREDPGEFYAGLDCVVLTSLNEGTPLSLIEAMACGKPWISTAVGGVVDLAGPVVHEKPVLENRGFRICQRGILVDSRNPSILGAAIEYLACNANLQENLSRRGKEYARKYHSRERLIADIRRLYLDSQV